MKKLHTFLCLVCAALLLAGMALPAAARELPDLERKGAITVTFDLPQDLASYGTLTLTHVASIEVVDGDDTFVSIAPLEDLGFTFEDLDSAQLAEAVAQAVQDRAIPGVTRPIGIMQGAVAAAFEELTLGVYLVTQAEGAEGYYAILPFLISVPTYSEESEEYEYELIAQSKSEPEPEPTEPTTEPATEPSTEPPTTEPPTTVPPTTKPDLPQTGQLNWPIPFLTMAGIGCILLGISMKRRREPDGYDV